MYSITYSYYSGEKKNGILKSKQRAHMQVMRVEHFELYYTCGWTTLWGVPKQLDLTSHNNNILCI